MNKKGFELAISTIILIVLGIFVLIALIIAVREGFERFNSAKDPLLKGAEGAAVKEACEIACKSESRLSYCCQNYTVGDFDLKCNDDRLGVECTLNCENVC